MHIDSVAFFKPASGIGMTVHYRDARGFSHRKTMRNPDASHIGHVEDMAVLMSEWLVHPTTAKADQLETAGSC